MKAAKIIRSISLILLTIMIVLAADFAIVYKEVSDRTTPESLEKYYEFYPKEFEAYQRHAEENLETVSVENNTLYISSDISLWEGVSEDAVRDESAERIFEDLFEEMEPIYQEKIEYTARVYQLYYIQIVYTFCWGDEVLAERTFHK